MDDGVVAYRGLYALFATAVVGVMIAGAALGSIGLFSTYDGTFARLEATDERLAQLLYNDSIFRQLKDTLLQQQDDVTNAELQAEITVREAGFWALYWAILNETSTRIAEEAILFSGLANETQARIAADVYIEAEILNLTSLVVIAEAYEAYSIAKFIIIINNITTLQALLSSEIAARIAGDALLTEQGAIADAAIAYLTITLQQDIHSRTVQDILINEWINALQLLGLGIESINGQTGSINNNVDIVSTNNLTTITTPSPGQLVFRTNAVRSLQGVGPAVGGSFSLTAGSGIAAALNGPHGLHFYSTNVIIPANSVTLEVYLIGTPLLIFGGAITDPWVTVPTCEFPYYNGGTCGWSAPDTGTYIVQISVTLTICAVPNGVVPGARHINMAIAKSAWATVVYGPATLRSLLTEKTGGILEAVDGSYIGTATSLISSNYCMDMGFTTTVVVSGPGCAGCAYNTGYGLPTFFNGFFFGDTVPALTIKYVATKVS